MESENGYINGDDEEAHIEQEGGYKSLQIEDNNFDPADNSFVPAAFSNDTEMNFQPIEKMETSEEPIQTTINNENFSYEAEEPISLSNENSPDNQNLNVLDAAESFLEGVGELYIRQDCTGFAG